MKRESRGANCGALLLLSCDKGGVLLVWHVVNDGEASVAQSSAILRYICGLGGLHPTDPLKAAAVDAALDQEHDAFASYVAAKCDHGATPFAGTLEPRLTRLD